MLTPVRLRIVAAILLPLAGIAGGGAAQAAEVSTAGLGPGYSAIDAPLGAPTQLTIDLKGEVAAHCRMTSTPAIANTLDLNHAGDANAAFGVDCNAPFQVSVRSTRGGFAAETPQEGVAAQVAYEVGIDIDTDTGANALGWCGADQLKPEGAGACGFGGLGWSSGSATAIDRPATLRVRWSAPGKTGALPLGTYRDTLVIQMAVRA